MNSIRQIEVIYKNRLVGRLALTRDGLCAFEYSPSGLVPAYDPLPIDGINGFRTTSINDKVEPAREDLIAVAVKSGLDEKEADAMFDRIHEIVSRKEDLMRIV